MKELDILKIGSKIVRNISVIHIEEIVRETKTLWITTNNTRIYKKNNNIMGCPYKYVRLALQKDYDKIDKMKLAYELHNLNFNEIDLNVLRKIKSLVAGKETK